MFGLFSLVVLNGGSLRADETLSTMAVAGSTYSNVTVLSTSATHVFVKYHKGFASFRLADLDADSQSQLGYAPPAPTTPSKMSRITRMADDPRIRQLQEEWTRRMGQLAPLLDKQLVVGFAIAALVAYFFFSYCCLLICRKTEYEPGIWVWVPIIQLIPMFKAARMSGWSFVLFFIPIVGAIVGVVWCFKICIARKKSAWLGLFLLLPVVNLLTLLYLAFADGVETQASSSVIKLQYS